MTGSDDRQRYFFALVDDEERIHDFLKAVLEEHGLLEKHASFFDPMSFIEFLETTEEEPDIILLDIHFEGSGLSGVDILPHIRDAYPYLPVILLTGMDTDAISEAEQYQCTYFIPKPVSPDHLSRMIRFYMGISKKSGEVLKDNAEYQQLLEQEIAQLQEQASCPEPEAAVEADRKSKAFQRITDLLGGLLQNSETMPSFQKDLETLFTKKYDLFRKTMEVLVRFDADISSPGLNIHKIKGTDHVFSARLSRKVRLYFYLGPKSPRRRLLRLDTAHDTKYMDRWIKDNYASYAH